ncbi:exodeoxyribonuclease V subunit beta [Methylocucumis oryzae]|uniref:RecBCD enzyme subunit RecB n=1 Tax=Methylocucumis oryzae TaxID=1632867 RepID=A0A0F3IIP8_9GAMM|nr:exodeoxyribonuclease V subunit beta [Methylocucumis oryzae]
MTGESFQCHQRLFFDPATTTLNTRINLIEASAGTGKTFALTMLVLRLLVEQAIPIDQLLIVTFTKAATEELKDRVRKRLTEAKTQLSNPDYVSDSTLTTWLKNLELDKVVIQQRLSMALLNIDQAGIFTIHGFCQRVLTEHALESGQLFATELISDISALKQLCTDDFWRKQISQRPIWEAAVLTANYKTPDELLASLTGFPSAAWALDTPLTILPEQQDLDVLLAELKTLAEQAQSLLPNNAKALTPYLASGQFKNGYSDNFDYHYQALEHWLTGGIETIPYASLTLFSWAGLLDALNGQKFRSTKALSGEQRKAEFLASLAIETKPFDALLTCYHRVALQLRRNLLQTLREQLSQHIQALNALTYDDLIGSLAAALQQNNSQYLVDVLQQRFRAALIDEFQDTDAKQWHIFSTAFNSAEHFVYLIGDPKQAIYKFRGADIYAYLSAQRQAKHRYTLGFNWRSHPSLVSGVNQLFQQPNAFVIDAINFSPVQPGRSREQGELYQAETPLPPIELWYTEPPEGQTYCSAGKATATIQAAVVHEIISLLSGNYRFKPDDTTVHPKDIAILVRTNAQAVNYQTALRTAGVPSVLSYNQSVFATQEAVDLYRLLLAVAHPGDSRLFNQALSLDWFGLDGQILYQELNDEAAQFKWLAHFNEYHKLWQTQGVLVMMHRLIQQQQVKTHLAKTLLAERRLTNLLHLLELVQQAALDEHLGIQKTLDWLRKQMTDASRSDNQLLRLESDAKAVQIITMHKAKGLEYPIVFCPFLWQDNSLTQNQDLIFYQRETGGIVDLGSEHFEQHLAHAQHDALAEAVRLAYVALTRAKCRCYCAWADVRTAAKPNDSALAWLLAMPENAQQQQSVLADYRDANPEGFSYKTLSAELTMTDACIVNASNTQAPELSALEFTRTLTSTWQMSSYTALSALSQHDVPELPADKAREPEPISDTDTTLVIIDSSPDNQDFLPKGADTGNVVHGLLEQVSFQDLAVLSDISELRDRLCLRYGVKLANPDLLSHFLQTVVSTPLDYADKEFCLKNIPAQHCLKEMPFYLTINDLHTEQINAILKDTPAYQALTHKQLSGFLTGFIDLICVYQQRYYVIDYKTNYLTNYSQAELTQAMREHNYGLQYWLYSVVLHQYLQNRLTDYHFKHHFGGVRYLFVRGMNTTQAMSGVYQDPLEFELLQRLSAVFASGGRI